MPLYTHLSHALTIMRAEPDYRKWGPLIEAVPECARQEVRDWLHQEATKRQLAGRQQRPAQPPAEQFL